MCKARCLQKALTFSHLLREALIIFQMERYEINLLLIPMIFVFDFMTGHRINVEKDVLTDIVSLLAAPKKGSYCGIERVFSRVMMCQHSNQNGKRKGQVLVKVTSNLGSFSFIVFYDDVREYYHRSRRKCLLL